MSPGGRRLLSAAGCVLLFRAGLAVAQQPIPGNSKYLFLDRSEDARDLSRVRRLGIAVFDLDETNKVDGKVRDSSARMAGALSAQLQGRFAQVRRVPPDGFAMVARACSTQGRADQDPVPWVKMRPCPALTAWLTLQQMDAVLVVREEEEKQLPDPLQQITEGRGGKGSTTVSLGGTLFFSAEQQPWGGFVAAAAGLLTGVDAARKEVVDTFVRDLLAGPASSR